MMFDPRTLSKYAYEALKDLRSRYDKALENKEIKSQDYKQHLQEQKSQAVELYTYVATWGLMRLKGEEIALDKWDPQKPPTIGQRTTKSQEGKREVIESYFRSLENVPGVGNLVNEDGLATLNTMKHDQYLGLTGVALAIAQEFSFWADAVYHDIKPGESD
ncbi:hypothetical protein [Moorena sp. SIO2C4]|uniref:hypothetical protein n=1 Tax=Moorena sp. SIO2C4 TaxID=2607824 RepID=UPI0013C719A6|nr:hypothetical protein [Moorena sp. SIO2C4]NES43582.1 hypothetical protein [Moorena sp. SIO2C4]